MITKLSRESAKAIRANLKLIECPIRHLGTEEGYKIYTRLQEHLLASGVEIKFMTMVQDIIIEDGVAKGVVTDKEETYYADEIVSGIGREGSSWFEGICKNHGIKTQNGTVDVGVRVEVRDEIMKELNEKLYEAKLLYTIHQHLTIRYAYSARTLPEKWQQSTTITDLQLSMVMLISQKT